MCRERSVQNVLRLHTTTVTGAPAAADGPAPPVAVPTSDREAPRFAPRSQDDLAPSGAVTRVRANLAAVQMVRALQAEGRRATPDEQKVLARWSGWGAVPEALDERRADFAWARAELAQLLSPEELRAAARNTLNAHYTDLSLVHPIWEAVARLGFTEGPVLEPGLRVGQSPARVHRELRGHLLRRQRSLRAAPVRQHLFVPARPVGRHGVDDRRRVLGKDRIAALVGLDLDPRHQCHPLGVPNQLVTKIVEPQAQTAAAEKRAGHGVGPAELGGIPARRRCLTSVGSPIVCSIGAATPRRSDATSAARNPRSRSARTASTPAWV
jgi:hypothetical protein